MVHGCVQGTATLMRKVGQRFGSRRGGVSVVHGVQLANMLGGSFRGRSGGLQVDRRQQWPLARFAVPACRSLSVLGDGWAHR